jgi:hypothetical protein
MKMRVPWLRLISTIILLLCLVLAVTATDSADDASAGSASGDSGSSVSSDAGSADSGNSGDSLSEGVDTSASEAGSGADAGGGTTGEVSEAATDASDDQSSAPADTIESGGAEEDDSIAGQDTGSSSPSEIGEGSESGAAEPVGEEEVAESEETDTGIDDPASGSETIAPVEPAAEPAESDDEVAPASEDDASGKGKSDSAKEKEPGDKGGKMKEEIESPVEEPLPGEEELVPEEGVEPELNATGAVVEETIVPPMASVVEPSLLCVWAQDDSVSLEDGDPLHSIDSIQFNPPCRYGAVKTVRILVVVRADTSPEPNLPGLTITGPDNGVRTVVPQVLTKEEGMKAWKAAAGAGIPRCADGISAEAVRTGLEQGLLQVLSGPSDLAFDAAPGEYQVEATSGVTGAGQEFLSQVFIYAPSACIEFDFNHIDYGTISLGIRSVADGDEDFETLGNATVRNSGNIPVRIQLEQDDMGIGKDSEGTWFISYTARLGLDGTEQEYLPEEQVTLPDLLPPGAISRLDFSILVRNGTGIHSGRFSIGCIGAE